MEKNIKQTYRDVLEGREPDRNIPLFLNRVADDCYTYSAVRLAMHYYTFYESYLDAESRWDRETNPLYTQLNRILSSDIINTGYGKKPGTAVSSMDRLRTAIMERMKLLMAYTDYFHLHEYVLNRVEYRFRDIPVTEEDEAFTRRVLQYIFNSQDNIIINDRIRDVISQLPMRLTKQKFFDLLRNSIHEYLGAQESTLDSYLYSIKSVAAPDIREESKAIYPELGELKDFLDRLDYRTIDAGIYSQTECRIRKAADMLEAEISHYYILEEIVNEAYSMLLCSPYAGVTAQGKYPHEAAALSIIKAINTSFMSDSKEEPSGILISKLSEIEGVQEELAMKLMMTEDALFHIDKNFRKLTESIMADKLLNVLLLVKDLLSGSLFIDFYEVKSIRKVDAAMADVKAQLLTEELIGSFALQDRMIVRAAMANTLNIIPVIFNNRRDVMDYCRYSLGKCRDAAEKAGCISIISDMMSE